MVEMESLRAIMDVITQQYSGSTLHFFEGTVGSSTRGSTTSFITNTPNLGSTDHGTAFASFSTSENKLQEGMTLSASRSYTRSNRYFAYSGTTPTATYTDRQSGSGSTTESYFTTWGNTGRTERTESFYTTTYRITYRQVSGTTEIQTNSGTSGSTFTSRSSTYANATNEFTETTNTESTSNYKDSIVSTVTTSENSSLLATYTSSTEVSVLYGEIMTATASGIDGVVETFSVGGTAETTKEISESSTIETTTVTYESGPGVVPVSWWSIDYYQLLKLQGVEIEDYPLEIQVKTSTFSGKVSAMGTFGSFTTTATYTESSHHPIRQSVYFFTQYDRNGIERGEEAAVLKMSYIDALALALDVNDKTFIRYSENTTTQTGQFTYLNHKLSTSSHAIGVYSVGSTTYTTSNQFTTGTTWSAGPTYSTDTYNTTTGKDIATTSSSLIQTVSYTWSRNNGNVTTTVENDTTIFKSTHYQTLYTYIDAGDNGVDVRFTQLTSLVDADPSSGTSSRGSYDYSFTSTTYINFHYTSTYKVLRSVYSSYSGCSFSSIGFSEFTITHGFVESRKTDTTVVYEAPEFLINYTQQIPLGTVIPKVLTSIVGNGATLSAKTFSTIGLENMNDPVEHGYNDLNLIQWRMLPNGFLGWASSGFSYDINLPAFLTSSSGLADGEDFDIEGKQPSIYEDFGFEIQQINEARIVPIQGLRVNGADAVFSSVVPLPSSEYPYQEVSIACTWIKTTSVEETTSTSETSSSLAATYTVKALGPIGGNFYKSYPMKLQAGAYIPPSYFSSFIGGGDNKMGNATVKLDAGIASWSEGSTENSEGSVSFTVTNPQTLRITADDFRYIGYNDGVNSVEPTVYNPHLPFVTNPVNGEYWY